MFECGLLFPSLIVVFNPCVKSANYNTKRKVTYGREKKGKEKETKKKV
jgi:hypothetical protein